VQARARKGRTPVTPKDVIEAITDLTLRDFGPAEIGRKLKADRRFRGRVLPGPRTIKKYVARAKTGGPEASEPWRLADADPDDAALVVPVLSAVVEGTLGHVRAISTAEAALIVRIVRSASDVEAWDAYRLARRLLSDPSADEDVQAYLSFAPWRDGGERYGRAYADGLIRDVIYRYETPKEARGGHEDEGDEHP